MRLRLAMLTCTLLVGAAALRATSAQETFPARTPLSGLPVVMGQWHTAGDAPLDPETLKVLHADDYLNRTYVGAGGHADLFIAYYSTQRHGETVHSPLNCLPGTGWQPVSIGRTQISVPGGAPIDANRYVIQKGLDTRLVYYWYQAHGRTMASEYTSKVFLVLDSLRLHRSDAAIVRVIAPIASTQVDADGLATRFARTLQPELGRYIPQ
jgi:EpsI family protein